MTTVFCPWCGLAAAVYGGRGAQAMPYHITSAMGPCPGTNRMVRFEVDDDETGRLSVRPQWPRAGEKWETTFLVDPDAKSTYRAAEVAPDADRFEVGGGWSRERGAYVEFEIPAVKGGGWLTIPRRLVDASAASPEEFVRLMIENLPDVTPEPLCDLKVTRLDEDGNPTGDTFVTRGTVKLTMTDVDPDLERILSGEPEPLLALDVGALTDDALCDRVEALADTLDQLGASDGFRLLNEAAERLGSYSVAYQRFVQITESFRVSPGQG